MNKDAIGDMLEVCVGSRLEEERKVIKQQQQTIVDKLIDGGTDSFMANCKAWGVAFSEALFDVAKNDNKDTET